MSWFKPRGAILPGERTIANFDEDSITMAIAAAADCLDGIEPEKVDGLYFASLNLPFKERQNAEIIATVLDLRADIKVADFTSSAKAGTTALLSAFDTVKAGSAKNILVCASDCRIARTGGVQEQAFGDGAVAFLVSEENPIATLEGSYSVSYDFTGSWRTDMEKYDHVWEDRYIRDVGYTKFIPEAISGVLNRCGVNPKDIARVCYPCTNGYMREHGRISKGLGFEAGQVQDNLFTTIGDTGVAYPLMIFVAAMEDAKPKDKIVVASYGYGSDGLLLQISEEIEKIKGKRRGVKKSIGVKKYIDTYEKCLTFREIAPPEKGIRAEEIGFTQMSLIYRDRREILALVGSKCKRCGTPVYPRQRVCVNPACSAIEEMEDYRFSEKKAKLFTYTGDYLAYSPSPPAISLIVDFEGGGRYWFDGTDGELEEMKVGMPMEMTFRKKFTDENRGVYGYFWKAKPLREGA
jgi:3-hydroxy-3-methylglutaryl CoA synthase